MVCAQYAALSAKAPTAQKIAPNPSAPENVLLCCLVSGTRYERMIAAQLGEPR
jgi:hypothetical protein